MRTYAFLLLVVAGCSSEPAQTEEQKERARLYAPAEGISAAKDLTFLDKYSGQYVTLYGVFQHEHFETGVVVLESGLRIRIPHFDHFATGDDWLKYVGHRCSATGILHTWTKNLPDYHSATLEIKDFSGSTSE